jgi:hypothetical protein
MIEVHVAPQRLLPWWCYPRIQTLEVYRLENGRWMELDTFEGNVKIRVKPFEAIELDIERIWRWQKNCHSRGGIQKCLASSSVGSVAGTIAKERRASSVIARMNVVRRLHSRRPIQFRMSNQKPTMLMTSTAAANRSTIASVKLQLASDELVCRSD